MPVAYSSDPVNLLGSNPGIGGVQSGILLHRGGLTLSISSAFSFSLVFFGSILRACCFNFNLQAISCSSSLCCLNFPMVYALRILSRRASSSSSAGGGLEVGASRAAKIRSRSFDRVSSSVLTFDGLAFFLDPKDRTVTSATDGMVLRYCCKAAQERVLEDRNNIGGLFVSGDGGPQRRNESSLHLKLSKGTRRGEGRLHHIEMVMKSARDYYALPPVVLSYPSNAYNFR